LKNEYEKELKGILNQDEFYKKRVDELGQSINVKELKEVLKELGDMNL